MVASYWGKINSMKEKKCGNHKIIIKNKDTIFKDCNERNCLSKSSR